jgi:uncharacterized protein involved in type VI secretion and phage assembly
MIEAPTLPQMSASSAASGLAGWAGLSSESRLYALQIEGAPALNATLQFEAFCGAETLSSLYRYELLLLSPDAQIPLGSLIGRQVRFVTRLSDGSSFPRSGYVARAQRLGADGALTRYQVTLVPWLWQATQRTDCRIFQEKTVLQIIEAVFAPYAPRAAWTLAEGVESFMESAPVRSYCVQYRESDFAFVSRLLAEEGLGFCFCEQASADQGAAQRSGQDSGRSPSGAASQAGSGDAELGDTPCHSLLIFAANEALPEDAVSAHALGGAGVRFHRAGSQEDQDAVTALGGRRILQAAVSTALSWDYKGKHSVAVSLPTDQAFGGPNAPRLEDYDVPGAYAWADEATALRYVRLAREAMEARNKVFLGLSSVRSFLSGHRFVLSNSPLDDQARLRGETRSAEDQNASRHFVLLSVQHAGINNLPRNLDETARVLATAMRAAAEEAAAAEAAAADTADIAPLIEQARQRGYANAFSAQRVHVPWRPALADATGLRRNARPTVPGVQSAMVVGAQGETTPGDAGEIHTDALHRVRVRFHWQRPPANGAAAVRSPRPLGGEGLGERGAESACSAWLRMANRYAGAGLGMQFVPRIGQEVLVGFLDNDIDRPIVLGSLYNGQGEDGVAPTQGGHSSTQSPVSSSQSPAFANAKDHAPAHQGNRIAAGNSPAWHGEGSAFGPMRNAGALSGFKSCEFNRPHAGYNQLVFDDTDQQQRIQLATTQAATQLNLGHLIHQADHYRGSHRGDGFELRTDAYGALRAGKGLLLTTWPIQAAPDKASCEPAGDACAPSALLKQAAALADACSQIAGTHQTVKLAAHEGNEGAKQSKLKTDKAPQAAQHQSAKGMVTPDTQSSTAGGSPQSTNAIPHSEDPLLTLAGRGGIGVVAGQSLQLASGEGITLASGQDSNFALAAHLRIHAGQALGLLSGASGKGHFKLIANQGPIIAQAQTDTLTLAAKEQLKMVSVNGKLDLASPKKIHLAVAGGVAITIEGGNITVMCPGMMTVHASQRSFTGPGHIGYKMPPMLSSEMAPQEIKSDAAQMIVLTTADGNVLKNRPYRIWMKDGSIIESVTDRNGTTKVLTSDKESVASIELLKRRDKAPEKEEAPHITANAAHLVILSSEDGRVLKNRPYRIWMNDQSVVEGITDKNGATKLLTSHQEEIASIQILKRRK